MENEYLKKIKCLSSEETSTTKKEKVIVVNELRQSYPLKSLLILAGIAKSTYCYINNTFKRANKDQELIDQISSIFYANKERYGYRRITVQLKKSGIIINHKKTQRLMRENQLFGRTPKARYKSYKGQIGKIA